ncbi:MAG TPA: CAP domain-containing protein [Candidatus Woesebacteria bacterium]|nr:hypothetical protein [Candidatus Shapirobacteria bacterium]HOR02278.1 CAP domain-containing protein [Candidatus Woesebacteria bacterium]
MKFSLSHYFIPQEKNNYRADILKNGFLILLVGIYLLNQSFIKYLTISRPGILGYSSEITAQKVFDQTNNERIKAGLPPLKYNSVLSESAAKKAKDMFADNYWAHTAPDGMTPWDFLKSVGYKYSVAGENLARDFYDTESLLKAWMNSPTHKANIIHPKYQEIGIGVVNGTLGGIKTTLVVQHFGTPIVPVVSKDTPSTNDEPSSLQPEEVITTADNQPVVSPDTSVLSQNQEKPINPLKISKILGVLIFGLIIVTLFIDGYITLKKGINRMTGSTVSQIGFLLVILLFILYQQQGVIF